MAKKEARPGEGGQEQKGTQIVRRDAAPLAQTEDTSDNPRALVEISLVGEETVWEGETLRLKKTTLKLRNLFKGKPKGAENDETSEPGGGDGGGSTGG